MRKQIELLYRVRTTLHDGSPVYDSLEHISSEAYYAEKGDEIILSSDDYVFAVGTYELERESKFKEEYCYLPDSLWLRYNQDLQVEDYSNKSYKFVKNCYYKICIKRSDGKVITPYDLERVQNCLCIIGGIKERHPQDDENRDYFIEEVEAVSKRVNSIQSQIKLNNSFSVLLIADTHNVVNGTWAETSKNISNVCSKVKIDCIVHLGDITDGIVSKKLTLKLANEVMDDLRSCHVPVYLTLGNHDSNYFRANRDYMSIEEQAAEYLNRSKPYYFVDSNDIRMIFLISYDNNRVLRYGYSDEELLWLENLLESTPSDMKTILFSHVAPVKKLDYWSEEIHNSSALMRILESYSMKKGNLIAFIHGHTHADNICSDFSFPIISVANNKCEDFTDYKPDGFITHKRSFSDKTQDLWDVLIINKTNRNLELVRFGAGADRSVKI